MRACADDERVYATRPKRAAAGADGHRVGHTATELLLELIPVSQQCREVRELFGIRTQSSSTVTDFFAAGFLHYSPTEDVQIQAVESTKARAVRRPA